MRRLEHMPGEWINRRRQIDFTFEGQQFSGFEGDTISSALLANGVRVLGRSFKYHRRRGPLSAANHDVNAMFQVVSADRSQPNVRGDVEPLRAGMQVMAVNTVGGLADDRLAVVDKLSRFLPVGFYYKAFLNKRRFPQWERRIRAAAGLGSVGLASERDARRVTAKRYAHTDVLVVGAGRSGLMAALDMANAGSQVLLAEECARIGGRALFARAGQAIDSRVQDLINAVEAHTRIRVLTRTFAAGYYADHWVPLVGEEYITKVRAKEVVIAQGAYEQPAVFRGNDLPGVMLASGAQRLIYRYAVAPASRVAVLTANAEGYAAALDAIGCGLEVIAVLDLRAFAHESEKTLVAGVRALKIPIHHNVRPILARAGHEGTLEAFDFQADGVGEAQVRIDGLWMSVGFAPANALLHQAGATMRFDPALEQFVPDTLPSGVEARGRVAGEFDLPGRTPSHPYPIFSHPNGKEFIDFDEDLTLRDLLNAFQEGFDSSELLKRYSTVGMGPSQGKHSNMNALRILAKLRGETLEHVGPTTARPMFHPVPLAHLAGRAFYPQRRTALHASHEVHGAVWMPAGDWQRPEYYARPNETREVAIRSEVLAVRHGVGLIDVGTLGKIEAHGAECAQFLDRAYGGLYSTLKQGMTRYGLLMDEAGIIIDDGVIARLGPEHFYFTTTTGNSGTLFREFGRLATLWGSQVGLVNLTGHFAAFNVAGPDSRAVLRKLTSLDLSHSAFPYLGVRETEVAGVRCRLMRVGFVGEIGYEIHLRAAHAVRVWDALLEAGRSHGIRPFGVEAQRMLRLEKGHIIVGQDTDGLTNPYEIGASFAIRMNKPFFVGQRSLAILKGQALRQQLVGFTLSDTLPVRVKESHLIITRGRIAGRVTSVGWSPTLGHVIGLALVDPEIAKTGELHIRVAQGEEVVGKICALPFYDEPGQRQHLEEAA